MTELQKKVLIKKLGAKSNKLFDNRYSPANREWFVRKIIDALLVRSVPDANIENETKKIINMTRDALNARIRRGFSAGKLAADWKLYDQLTSRTQIIYGMIAMHPDFLLDVNAAYFDFILERRFRSIQRMNFTSIPTIREMSLRIPIPTFSPQRR